MNFHKLQKVQHIIKYDSQVYKGRFGVLEISQQIVSAPGTATGRAYMGRFRDFPVTGDF